VRGELVSNRDTGDPAANHHHILSRAHPIDARRILRQLRISVLAVPTHGRCSVRARTTRDIFHRAAAAQPHHR
jgi:hypothetical protein